MNLMYLIETASRKYFMTFCQLSNNMLSCSR